MIPWAEFQRTAKEELELCAVSEGQTVVVLSQVGGQMDYTEAFLLAARDLGAQTYNLRLGSTASVFNGGGAWKNGVNPLAGNEAAIRALENADLVVDLVFLLWSPEQLEIQKAGTRILSVIEPVQTLLKMFPTQDQTRRVGYSVDLLKKASTLRFTNRAGTDVTYQLGQYSVLGQKGFTDTRGGWDHWPSGFVLTAANDNGVNGRVVLDAGDIIAAPFGRYITEQVELVIENGAVQKISGGVDAHLIEDYFADFSDPRGYAVSHIGWGVNENARWASMANSRDGFGQEARAFYGCVMFSLGPNVEVGGTNDTPAHMDLPMRRCSLYLDSDPLLVDGEFADPELIVPGAAGR
jgi:2,5-dihydroxypyridine 5,6-dioxygenase